MLVSSVLTTFKDLQPARGEVILNLGVYVLWAMGFLRSGWEPRGTRHLPPSTL